MQSLYRTLILAILMAMFAVRVGPFAQGNGAWEAGRWKVNVAKSTANCGPAAQSVTNTWEDRGGDVEVFTQEGIDAQGRPFRNMYTFKYDGKEYPTVYNATTKTQGTIALRRVGPVSVEFTTKQNGKLTRTTTRTLSQDKKVINMTSKGINAEGQACNDTSVWDRQ